MEWDVDVTLIFIRFLGLVFVSFGIDEWGSAERLFKNGAEEDRAVAPAAKAVEENFNLGYIVSLVGRKGVVSVDHPNDGAFDDAGSVAARCGQIQVRVFGFLVDLGDESSIFNGDCDIHEIDRVTSIFDFPG